MPLGLHKCLDSKVNKKKTKQQKIDFIKISTDFPLEHFVLITF